MSNPPLVVHPRQEKLSELQNLKSKEVHARLKQLLREEIAAFLAPELNARPSDADTGAKGNSKVASKKGPKPRSPAGAANGGRGEQQPKAFAEGELITKDFHWPGMACHMPAITWEEAMAGEKRRKEATYYCA